MAIIKKRGNKFCVVYKYYNDIGEQKQKWETYNTEKEANKRKLEVELDKLNNNQNVPIEMTFREFFETKFLVLHGKSKWRYSTYENNISVFKNHILPYLGKKKLSAITPIMIEELYEKLRTKKVSGFKSQKVSDDELPCLSSTTIKGVHTLLKKFFTKAVQWKFIAQSPVVCDAPKARDFEKTIWNAENFYEALNDMGDDEVLRLAVHIAFVGALRAGEVVGLTWDCIDLERNEFKINKTLQRVSLEALDILPKDDLIYTFPKVTLDTKSILVLKKPKTRDSNRVNYITPPLKEDLMLRKQQIEKDKAYYGDDYKDYNLVFCFEDGRPVEPKRCSKWFRIWQKKTGPDLNKIDFHAIRHSSATYFLGLSDFDVKTVQDITGHGTTSQLTDGYAHKVKENKKLLLKRFAFEFYNEKTVDDEKNKSIDGLIELMKNDPSLRETIQNALDAQKDINIEG